jgi:hypothetical protein
LLYAESRRFGPDAKWRGSRLAFTFKLEWADGAPADPPVLRTIVPTWRVGDTIQLGADRTLRVIETRDAETDEAPVLVVEAA